MKYLPHSKLFLLRIRIAREDLPIRRTSNSPMKDVSQRLLRKWLSVVATLCVVGLIANCSSLVGADFDRPGPMDATVADEGAGEAGSCYDNCAGKCGQIVGSCGKVVTCGGCPSGRRAAAAVRMFAARAPVHQAALARRAARATDATASARGARAAQAFTASRLSACAIHVVHRVLPRQHVPGRRERWLVRKRRHRLHGMPGRRRVRHGELRHVWRQRASMLRRQQSLHIAFDLRRWRRFERVRLHPELQRQRVRCQRRMRRRVHQRRVRERPSLHERRLRVRWHVMPGVLHSGCVQSRDGQWHVRQGRERVHGLRRRIDVPSG